jgi:RNA 2',3'-cyclic 3'-phosphodiesterase
MTPEKTRCFIALNVPDELKELAQTTAKEIQSRNLVEARYTKKDAIHLTLKFLGEIDEKQVKQVAEQLRKIKFNKFTVTLKGMGIFPQDGNTRIIWYALGGEELMTLQRMVDDSLENIFEREKRFMAHITIARVKEDLNQKELLEFLSSIKSPEKEYTIDKFSLIKSTQTSEGSEYETLEDYSLL